MMTSVFMILLADKTMEEFPYLAAVGLNSQLLAEIFTLGAVSAELFWHL